MVNTVYLESKKYRAHSTMSSLSFTLGKIAEYVLLMAIGGFVYTICEMIYRTYTHWTMFVVGGLCLIVVGLLNEGILPRKWGIIPQCLVGSLAITLIEFVSGLIINVYLGWNVWDYSDLPFNIMGQICIPFMIIWVFLAYAAIRVDDFVRYRFFGEPYPTYVWWMMK